MYAHCTTLKTLVILTNDLICYDTTCSSKQCILCEALLQRQLNIRCRTMQYNFVFNGVFNDFMTFIGLNIHKVLASWASPQTQRGIYSPSWVYPRGIALAHNLFSLIFKLVCPSLLTPHGSP